MIRDIRISNCIEAMTCVGSIHSLDVEPKLDVIVHGHDYDKLETNERPKAHRPVVYPFTAIEYSSEQI